MLFCLSLFAAELIPDTRDALVFFYDNEDLVSNGLMGVWIDF